MKEDYIYIDKSSIENPFSNDTSEIRLRDHFAAMAMQGLVSTCRNESYESTAIVAYRMADAMLKEREKWKQ